MSIENLDMGQSREMAQKAQMARKMSAFDNVRNTSKSNMSVAEKTKIEQASRGFESIFVNMMLKEMKQAQLGEQDDEGFGSTTMQEMAQLNFSDNVSKQGRGMGIAQMMYKQMTGDNLPTRSSYSVPTQQMKPVSISENTAQRISKYDEIIDKASKEYGIPKNLIKSVIAAESAGNHAAVSPAGAKGLMQLMDGTAASLGVSNSFNPEENIFGGTNYLNKMLNKFDGSLELALAAYNAGPGNVEKHNGIPPFDETRKYVSRVLSYNSALGEE